MQHIQGISRNQLHASSLEDKITSENPVRFIDAFVEHIDLQKVGFTAVILKKEGRPSFNIQVFLKIYLYRLFEWYSQLQKTRKRVYS